MPRKRQRFADLERQLKRLNGAAPAAGSDLDNYVKWKSGANKIKVTQKLTAAQRQRYKLALLPFSLGSTNTSKYIATITNYSNGFRTTASLSDADCGYSATDSAISSSNFYPAVIRCSVRNDDTLDTPTSGILKKEYSTYKSRSYTIPFGRVTGRVSEDVARRHLVDQVKAATTVTVRSITFEPEILKPASDDLKELAGLSGAAPTGG